MSTPSLETLFQNVQNAVLSEGYYSDTYMNSLNELRSASENNPNSPFYLQALWGLWIWNMNRFNRSEAQQISDEFRNLAEKSNNPLLVSTSFHMRGCNRFHMDGNVTKGISHFRNGTNYFQNAVQSKVNFSDYDNTATFGLTNYIDLANAYLISGQFDQSLASNAQVFNFENNTKNVALSAYSAFFSLLVYYMRGEYDKADSFSSVLPGNLDEPYAQFFAKMSSSLFSSKIEKSVSGSTLNDLQSFIMDRRDEGSYVVSSMFNALYLETLLNLGQNEEAFEFGQSALSFSNETRERLYLAEVYRNMGRATNLLGREVSETRFYLEQAMEEADSVGSPLFSLKAGLQMRQLEQQYNLNDQSSYVIASSVGNIDSSVFFSELMEATALNNRVAA